MGRGGCKAKKEESAHENADLVYGPAAEGRADRSGEGAEYGYDAGVFVEEGCRDDAGGVRDSDPGRDTGGSSDSAGG